LWGRWENYVSILEEQLENEREHVYSFCVQKT
jgi:hypothetical protein